MSLCIQYSKPASGSSESEIFGFDVAVTSLMNAWFKYGKAAQFICRPTDLASFDHFKALAKAQGIDAGERCVGLDPRHPEKNLQSISCLFRADPLTADLIWRRQQMKGRGYATCGLVHTMSGERIARAVTDLCVAPSDAGDALICPSNSIRDAVLNLWEIHTEYLNHRFGGKFACPVQTAVIPLGIDTDHFSRLTAPAKRLEQRAALGASEDEVVMLFVGRLSFATKAHPLPLFLAAEKAATQSKRKVRLVMFGYFKPKEMETFFRALASDVCKTVIVEFIQNNDPRFPEGLWAGADIFTSLSDNVQESFGLTPIEAMASGLPCVISDWDGYREGVRDGMEGFLIPTMTPPPSSGLAIAQAYYNQENYGVALSGAAQSTSVDIEACAIAFQRLIKDPGLRNAFGVKGRKRANELFDWRHVIAKYEALWQSLSDRRLAAGPSLALPENWQAVHPAFPNPWQMFKSFPTTHMVPSDVLHIAMSNEEVNLVFSHNMNFFVPALLSTKESLLDLIDVIRRAKSARIQDLVAAFPAHHHDVLWRCLGWFVKHGICTHEQRKPA